MSEEEDKVELGSVEVEQRKQTDEEDENIKGLDEYTFYFTLF